MLCLFLVVFCGPVGATLLTPAALYLFPRRWPAKAHRDEEALDSLQCETEEETSVPEPEERWSWGTVVLAEEVRRNHKSDN